MNIHKTSSGPLRAAALLAHLLLMAINVTVLGQSGHYWTQQYGTRSMLLSGSVIGGVEDLAAVYYNPARLAMVENSAFLLSANVYEWTNIKITDAFGDNKNASKSDFDGVPSLAAGTFKVKFLPNHTFAYAVLSRHSSNLNFSYRDEVIQDVIDNAPGDELFGAEIKIGSTNKTEWMGFSWSHMISPNFSIGATGFFSQERQSRSNFIKLNALTQTNDVALYYFNRSYALKQYSLLAKLGMVYQLKSVLLGLTINTPQLNLFGDGSYDFEKFISGLEPFTGRKDFYTTTYQENLDVKTKNPLSVGFGITFPLLKGKGHVSTEWFNSVPNYQLLKAASFTSQSNADSTYAFTLYDDLNSVINVGFGWEILLNEKISGYLSTSTDFSAVPDKTSMFIENKESATNSTIKSDYYHFGGGIVLKLKGADIMLGATYAGARQRIERPLDFPDDGDNGSIVDSSETSRLELQRWRFVFSFSVPFLKDYAKRLEEKVTGKDKKE